jgi:hypothetical protein
MSMTANARRIAYPPAPYIIVLYSVTYGNGTFVAVGGHFPTLSSQVNIFTSPDGITWTYRSVAAYSVLSSVAYGNRVFVAVGAGILTSPEGVIWTPRDSGSYSPVGVTYGNGTFVAVGYNGMILQSDPVK